MSNDMHKKITSNPKFAELRARRTAFAYTLSAVMLAIYFGFILTIAFAPKVLGTPISEGAVTTLGFPIGVAVIISAVILTGIYVRRANTEFDDLARQILEEAR